MNKAQNIPNSVKWGILFALEADVANYLEKLKKFRPDASDMRNLVTACDWLLENRPKVRQHGTLPTIHRETEGTMQSVIIRYSPVGEVTVFGPLGKDHAVERLDRVATKIAGRDGGKNIWLDDAVRGQRFEIHELLLADSGVRFSGAGVK